MRHVFFAERAARKIPGIGKDVKPRTIAKAGVLGAGTMGGGIAMNFANAGIPVTLVEQSQENLDRGMGSHRAELCQHGGQGPPAPGTPWMPMHGAHHALGLHGRPG